MHTPAPVREPESKSKRRKHKQQSTAIPRASSTAASSNSVAPTDVYPSKGDGWLRLGPAGRIALARCSEAAGALAAHHSILYSELHHRHRGGVGLALTYVLLPAFTWLLPWFRTLASSAVFWTRRTLDHAPFNHVSRYRDVRDKSLTFLN